MENNFSEFFPFLSENKDLKRPIYFDSAATTLKPKCFFEAIEYGYKNYSFPAGKSFYNEAEKTFEIIQQTKIFFSEIMNTEKESISFFPTASWIGSFIASENNLLLENSASIKVLAPIDVHNSLIHPWLNLKNKKIEFDWYDNDNIKHKIKSKFDIFLITLKSNLTGNVFDLNILEEFKFQDRVPLIIVDACQYFSTKKLDFSIVKSLGIDMIYLSGHKIYGPYNISPAYISERFKNNLVPFIKTNKNLEKPKELGLETMGSISAPDLYAFKKSLEWVEENIYKKETEIISRYNSYKNEIIKFLKSYESIKIVSNENCENIISFYSTKINSHDISQKLAEENIMVRSGNICNEKYAEIKNIPSIIRISIAYYNNNSDISSLINKLKEIL